MEMGERIKERRLQMKYTQEELAEKLGLQKSAIAKYENGRVENIKRSTIQKMATILECSPAYLMGWDSNQNLVAPTAIPRIMNYYNKLNDLGKTEATKRVEELTYFPNYTQDISSNLNAAHENNPTPEQTNSVDHIMKDDSEWE